LNFSTLAVFGEPYFKTHVKYEFVKQNTYIGRKADTTTPPKFISIKDQLPQPVWNSRPDVLKCYRRIREIAFSNLKKVNPKSGFCCVNY